MKMNKVVIGGMRYRDRTSAVATIRAAIDAGFNYIETSPGYCQKNSESWVGEAVNHSDYRTRVMVSTKCSPGNGGHGFAEFRPESGFDVRTVDQVAEVFAQSLRRLNLPRVDYYHMWTTHTHEQFAEAMKPGGWYDGVLALRDKWDHLGISSHASSDVILDFLKSGKFDTLTIPLNVVDTTRLDVVKYCAEHGIRVLAMNPLGGGFLAAHEELKELALRYLMTLDNVHLLIGFRSVDEVKYAKWIQDTILSDGRSADEILARVSELIDASEPRCTACGYCQPCPQKINVGASLSYYNLCKYMGLEEAREAFQEKQWEEGLRLDLCESCGDCETRCPNKLSVMAIIKDAQKLLYEKKP